MEKLENNMKELEHEKTNFETMVSANMETAKHWKHAVIAIVIAWALTIAGFIWFLLQFNFETSIESVGVYSIVDSNGNYVAQDISPETWESFIEWQKVLSNGKD